jgi:hypothetical protein
MGIGLHASIFERMGQESYEQVFAPGIRQPYDARQSNRDIRGTIRREWKPSGPKQVWSAKPPSVVPWSA